MIGTTISHYKILEKLGEGGMGIVYKAEDTKLKRTVALKFIPPAQSADGDAKQRFIQEAQAASALDHPNICTIHEIDETEDGQTFIVMAYYKGESLKEKLKQGPMDIEQAIRIALDVAAGLARAHEAGIVHRDIKPANIMITDRGEVRIVDFGLAKLSGQTLLTKTGSTLGTAAYMSPEQVLGENVDHRSDIWSLGVVLYEMVTGQRPFRGEVEQAVMYNITNEEPEPLTGLQPDVFECLEMIIAQCLVKEQEERYEHAEHLILDLQGMTRGDTPIRSIISARKTSVTTLFLSHKRSVLFAATATIVLIIAAILVYSFQTNEDIIDSIAILPVSASKENTDIDHLIEGIPEGIITSLRKLSNFRIIPFSTIRYHYKNKKVDPIEVGKAHNVRAVVFSELIERGSEILIRVEIVDTKKRDSIFFTTYKALRGENLAQVQSDITRDITKSIGLRMTAKKAAEVLKLETYVPLAYEYYKKGRLFWKKRTAADLDSAMWYFDRAIETDPNFALAYSGKGDTYLRLREYAGAPLHTTRILARFAAEKALQLDASLAESHATMGRLLNLESRYLVAQKEFAKAIELDPNYVPAYHWLALNYADRREYHHAINTDLKALKIDPESPVIANDLAAHYITGIEFAKGHVQHKKNIKKFPDHIGVAVAYSIEMDSLSNVNRVVDAAGEGFAPDELSLGDNSSNNNIEKALQAARKILVMDSLSLGNNIDMGQLYVETGQYDNALRQFKKTLAINPNYAKAYVNIGIMYRVMKNYEKSIEHFNRALQLDPSSPEANTQLAITYKEMGDYDRAEAEFKKALGLNPFNVRINNYLEGFYFQTRRYRNAVEYFKQQTELYPNESTTLYHYYGRALELTGEYKQALHSYQHAVDLDPSSLMSMIWLYFGYMYNSNIKGEQEVVEHIQKMHPGNSWIHLPLARIHVRKGNYKEAAYNLHKVHVAQRGFSDYSLYNNLFVGRDDDAEIFHTYLQKLRNMMKQKFGIVPSAYRSAQFYTWMDKPDSAFIEINTLVKHDVNGWYLRMVISSPDFSPLHKDPRWDKLLKDLKLDQYSDKLKRN